MPCTAELLECIAGNGTTHWLALIIIVMMSNSEAAHVGTPWVFAPTLGYAKE